jgi:DNA-binding CsgD family transcriptional regulator
VEIGASVLIHPPLIFSFIYKRRKTKRSFSMEEGCMLKLNQVESLNADRPFSRFRDRKTVELEPLVFSVAGLRSISLTHRESEVLFWVAKDKSNAGVAQILGCSEGTVRKHLENVYGKMGVQTRMGAVMWALERLGLIKE